MTAFRLIVSSGQASVFAFLGSPKASKATGLTQFQGTGSDDLPTVRSRILKLNEAGHTALYLPDIAWKAIFFDMDSTVIREESINELARAVGKEDIVAALTERAMAGQLDFAEALRERVLLLKGLSNEALISVGQSLTINPGMNELNVQAHARGIKLYLVSGGFNALALGIVEKLGFHGFHANELEAANGSLTGKLSGPLVDAEGKAQFLRDTCRALSIATSETLVVGDGANDLLMMKAGGAAIGYHPKPVLLPHVFGSIFHDHSALAAILS